MINKRVLLLAPISVIALDLFYIGLAVKIYLMIILPVLFFENIKISKSMVSILQSVGFLLLVGGISMLVSDIATNYKSFVHDVLFLMMIIFLLNIKLSKNTLKVFHRDFIRYIHVSFAVFLIYVSVSYLAGGSMSNIESDVFRLSGTMGASVTAIYLSLVFTTYFTQAFFNKGYGYYILSGFVFFLTILTGTRIAIVAIIVMMFYTLFRSNSNKKLLLMVFLTMLTVIAGFFILERMFFDGNIALSNINTNGRTYLWSNLLSAYIKSPYIGNGFGSVYVYISTDDLLRRVGVQPHNDYIRFLFNTGALGFSIFIYTLYLLIKKIFLINNDVVQNKFNQQLSLNYGCIFLIIMITDNIIIYIIYLYPFVLFYSYTLQYSNYQYQKSRKL